MRLNFRKALLLPAAIFGVALTAAAQSVPPVSLDIHVDQIKAHSSPTLYGLMTEEINHSYDGGLYGDLISNGVFYSGDSWQTPIPDWLPVEKADAIATYAPDKTTGPSTAIPYSVKLTVKQASASAHAGVANSGYWGIPVRPSTTYRGSIYAKSAPDSGPIHIALVNNNSGAEAAHADIPALTSDWKQYHFTFTTSSVEPSSLYQLEITASRPGTYWFSLVSLFGPTYHNRRDGNRVDLMDKLAAMHPTFLLSLIHI